MLGSPRLELKKTYSFFEILSWAAEQKRKGRSLPRDLEELLEKNRSLLESSDSKLKLRLPYSSLAFYYKKEQQEKLHFISHIKHINPAILYYTFNQELEQGGQSKEIQLSMDQLNQLQYGIDKLYYLHGNVELTGTPLVPGAIAPIVFFQWGNLMGIIKYVVLPAEKALVGNMLLRIEDMQDQKLEECLLTYAEKNLGLTLTPAQLLRQCTVAQPQQLPQLLSQYTAAYHERLLQSPAVLWPPRPTLRPGPFGVSKEEE